MNVKIIALDNFRREAKRLIKKYNKVYLLSIYDKSEYDNIPDSFLSSLIQEATEIE